MKLDEVVDIGDALSVEIVDLLNIKIKFFESIGDLLCCQLTVLLSLFHEVFHDLLFVFRHIVYSPVIYFFLNQLPFLSLDIMLRRSSSEISPAEASSAGSVLFSRRAIQSSAT